MTVAIIATGGIVAAGGYFAINNYANSRLQRHSERLAGEISEIIAKSIDRNVALAESAAARVSKPDTTVNRWAFFQFIRAHTRENPGLRAVEWLPRVSHQERVTYEKNAQADGLLDFHFLELSPDGRRVRAAQHKEYYPVFFVEPYPGNEDQLGLDLASDKKFADFLAKVRDTGRTEATLTEAVSQAKADVPGFLVVVPAYKSGIAPSSVPERRKKLLGFISAKFRFDTVLRQSRARLGTLPAMDVFILLYGGGKKPLIFHSFTSRKHERGEAAISTKDVFRGVHAVRRHDVAGLRWGVAVKAVQDGNQSLFRLAALGFVAFTLLLTTLLLRHMATMRIGRDHAEAANRAKSEFLAMMSHELRTPLNAVIGFSDVMLKEFFGPLGNVQYKTYSAHINRSATHLLEMINCILDLASLEAGHFKLEKEKFRLRRIAETIFPILQEIFGDSGVDIDEDISESEIVLNGDPRAFRQILQNLVSNAVKYTPEGGRVSVTSVIDPEGQFRLSVTDNGIGIAEGDLDAVLKPFHQVDTSLSRRYEGAGLGLPITYKLVELHGGTLQIDSDLGKGTTVRAIFPKEIVVPDSTFTEKVSPEPRPGSGVQGPAAEPEGKGLPKRKAPQNEKAPAAKNKAAGARR